MDERTDAGGSSFGRIALLALAFAAGYVLGSRRGGPSTEWQDADSEPTEITIEDGQGEPPEESEE
ncbi:hypothetical protein [Halorussus halobius]|uniref:hypothetical protein n=1 Tax=Halorussus halobius TaxID=1710537 RepID=UPI001092404C|nr:hypothetical protein [Halorussus halobius]